MPYALESYRNRCHGAENGPLSRMDAGLVTSTPILRLGAKVFTLQYFVTTRSFSLSMRPHGRVNPRWTGRNWSAPGWNTAPNGRYVNQTARAPGRARRAGPAGPPARPSGRRTLGPTRPHRRGCTKALHPPVSARSKKVCKLASMPPYPRLIALAVIVVCALVLLAQCMHLG